MSSTKLEQFEEIFFNNKENQQKFDALCDLIDLGQDNFALVLIEYDIPSQMEFLLDKLQEFCNSSSLKLVHARLETEDRPNTQLNSLDRLKEVAKPISQNNPVNVLVVTGFEKSFPPLNSEKDVFNKELAQVIQPFNLGRSLLKEYYPCPFLLCLPSKGMQIFLRVTPDLSSWRSGFFQFHSNLDEIRAEINKIAKIDLEETLLQKRKLSPEELLNETKHINSLIEAIDFLDGMNVDIKASLQVSLAIITLLLGDKNLAKNILEKANQLTNKYLRDKTFRKILKATIEDSTSTILGELFDIGANIISTLSSQQNTIISNTPNPPLLIQQNINNLVPSTSLVRPPNLYGRDQELENLFNKVTSVTTRFLTIWGPIGSGKSVLVKEGLLPNLNKDHYLTVNIRQWKVDDNIALIQNLLKEASDIEIDPNSSLVSYIYKIAQKTQKTLVIICDQFEQFFYFHKDISKREPFLKVVEECIKNEKIDCKFIFVIQEEYLGYLANFDYRVDEPLALNKRFHLEHFSANNAMNMLKEIAGKSNLSWNEKFISLVVRDLIKDGQVKPIEVQILSLALILSGTNNELAYIQQGRAENLLNSYLDLTLQKYKKNPSLVNNMEHVLVALIKDEKRVPLSSKKIMEKAKFSPKEIKNTEDLDKILNLLIEENLIIKAQLSDKYEITHDYLVGLIVKTLLQEQLRATNQLRKAINIDIKYQEQGRIWGYILRWSYIPRLPIYLHILAYADKDLKNTKEAKNLFYRYLIVNLVVWLFFISMPIMLIQASVAYLSIEPGGTNRVIARNGLKTLTFLPFIGGTASSPLDSAFVPLDTGFVQNNFDVEKLEQLLEVRSFSTESNKSRILTKENFINSLNSDEEKGLLWCQIGEIDKGLTFLEGEDPVFFQKLLKIGSNLIPEKKEKFLSFLSKLINSKQISLNFKAELINLLQNQEKTTVFKDTVAFKDNYVLSNLFEQSLKNSEFDISATSSSRISAITTCTLLANKDTDKKLLKRFSEILLSIFRNDKADPQLRKATIEALTTLINKGLLNEDFPFDFSAFSKDLRNFVENDRIDPLIKTPAIKAITVLADNLLLDEKFLLDFSKSLFNISKNDNNPPPLRSSAIELIGVLADNLDKNFLFDFSNLLLNLSKDIEKNKLSLGLKDSIIKTIGNFANKGIFDEKRLSNFSIVLLNISTKKVDDNQDILYTRPSAIKTFLQLATNKLLGKNLLSDFSVFFLDSFQDTRKDIRARSLAINIITELVKTNLLSEEVLLNFSKSLIKDLQTYINRFENAENKNDRINFTYSIMDFIKVLPPKYVIDIPQETLLLTRFSNEDICKLLLSTYLAQKAAKQLSPQNYLLDHLKGDSFLVKNHDATQDANYRNVVVSAIAQYIVNELKDEKDQPLKDELRKRLVQMWQDDPRLHLRIAIWNVFVEIDKLENSKETNYTFQDS